MTTPCGEMIGHGERCSVGWLCDICKENEQLRRDHAAAVKEANIAKARLKGVQKLWHADRAALQELNK